jgi:site-specific DNA-methyltransferase (adenine-specific)
MVAVEDAGFEIRTCLYWCFGSGFPKSANISKALDRMAGAPATEEARQWDGWGTALKPAVEIAVLARKPLGECTVARNVIRHGVGALNIDACRVETSSQDTTQGRWPAHLLLDGSPEVLACFPETGISSGGRIGKKDPSSVNNIGSGKYRAGDPGFGDAGSAARYFPTFPPTDDDRKLFYSPKASKADRGEGNNHPTVKPVALMRWLVKLVTPPGGLVLDPFAGSGSTGVACVKEGFDFVGIEKDRAYAEIAERRIEKAVLGCAND